MGDIENSQIMVYEVLDIKNIYHILNIIIDNKHMMMNITVVNIEFLIFKKNPVDICKKEKKRKKDWKYIAKIKGKNTWKSLANIEVQTTSEKIYLTYMLNSSSCKVKLES